MGHRAEKGIVDVAGQSIAATENETTVAVITAAATTTQTVVMTRDRQQRQLLGTAAVVGSTALVIAQHHEFYHIATLQTANALTGIAMTPTTDRHALSRVAIGLWSKPDISDVRLHRPAVAEDRTLR